MVTAAVVANLAEAVRPLGIDLAGLCARAGLAQPTEGGVSLTDYFRLRAAVVALLDDETCNLSARQLVPGSTQFVLEHVPDRITLTQLMRVLSDAYNILHGGIYNRVEEIDNRTAFVVDDNNFPYTLSDDPNYRLFLMETTLIYLYGLLSLLLPGPASLGLRAVWIRRPGALGDAPHLGFWTVPLVTNASTYRLVYDSEIAARPAMVARPLPATNQLLERRLIEALEALMSAQAPRAGVAGDVRALLHAGLLEQEVVAMNLGISPATLRRQLSREGVSFRDLRASILHERARTLLSAGRPIPEIAEQLGFSDIRSFNRAFRQWQGSSPAQYRQGRPTAT